MIAIEEYATIRFRNRFTFWVLLRYFDDEIAELTIYTWFAGRAFEFGNDLEGAFLENIDATIDWFVAEAYKRLEDYEYNDDANRDLGIWYLNSLTYVHPLLLIS